ncbi:MAG: hypothetical protein QOG20_4702 [Pseudonocardiales bacterium]|uniref:hypothetical protein n=1 Tax=Pseudonocardia sp. TaxID=60912 RepID=UPI00261580D6|nr:hypothetical protein [Pseudonocardia sp.]MCW2718274.1 hypothetical protein [Pseudonocardia sp.]MDT7616242.1 hypothetical protein [Pseudonocardiales bacterium]MDT7709095.1 hypothetical protein [Pseudonocardiales bacterium]
MKDRAQLATPLRLAAVLLFVGTSVLVVLKLSTAAVVCLVLGFVALGLSWTFRPAKRR